MRKLTTSLTHSRHMRPPSTRRTIHLLFGVCLVLLSAPLVYELASLCHANWQSMYGRIGYVETPILDSLRGMTRTVSRMLQQRTNRVFLDLPWRPSLIISLGFAWALFMSVPLRRA